MTSKSPKNACDFLQESWSESLFVNLGRCELSAARNALGSVEEGEGVNALCGGFS